MRSQDAKRRENVVREFDRQTVADTLRKSAALRARLRFCRHDLMLDDRDRPCAEREATQASTQGCIRIAAMDIMPHNRHDARDLAWQAATAFQRYIGYGINTYDEDCNITSAQVSEDLKRCAEKVAARPMTHSSAWAGDIPSRPGAPVNQPRETILRPAQIATMPVMTSTIRRLKAPHRGPNRFKSPSTITGSFSR